MPTAQIKGTGVEQDWVPTVFAVAKNREFYGMEHGYMPIVRLGWTGARKVFCVRMRQLIEYVTHKQQPPSGKTIVTFKAVNDFLKSASLDDLKKFMAAESNANVVYHSTLGPQDGFYLPAGWGFAEQVMSAADFVGLRLAVLSIADLPVLHAMHTHVLSAKKKTNEALQRVVNFLALADG